MSPDPRRVPVPGVLAGGRDALPAEPADVYGNLDWSTVRRMGLALWSLGIVLTAAMTAMAPPVHAASPPVGWGVAGLVLLIALAITRRLVVQPRISMNELLAGSMFAVVGIGALAVLSDSQVYVSLLVLPAVYAAIVHPVRRALLVLALGIAVSAFSFDSEASTPVVQFVARTLLWCGIATLGMAWAHFVRRERMQLESARAVEHERASSDALTGLGNRRAFDDAVAVEIARADRSGMPLLLLSLDLDDFKRINDVHGHLAGDEVLRGAAHVLARHSRLPDIWFRWGGDEFVGLYPGATLADAAAISRRMLARLREHCMRPEGTPLTAQIGAAQWAPAMSADELVALADAEVMAAKHRRGARRYGSHPA